MGNVIVGCFLTLGGTMGYARKGSVPSLVGGAGCGAALIGSSVLAPRNPRLALILATVISGLLTAGMVPRAIKTKKMMPAGMVALLGIVAFLYNSSKLRSS